jgi:hypothetical protein
MGWFAIIAVAVLAAVGLISTQQFRRHRDRLALMMLTSTAILVAIVGALALVTAYP